MEPLASHSYALHMSQRFGSDVGTDKGWFNIGSMEAHHACTTPHLHSPILFPCSLPNSFLNSNWNRLRSTAPPLIQPKPMGVSVHQYIIPDLMQLTLLSLLFWWSSKALQSCKKVKGMQLFTLPFLQDAALVHFLSLKISPRKQFLWAL